MNTSIHMSLCIWIKWSSLGEPSAHWSLWSKPSPGAAPAFSCKNSPKYLYLFSLEDGFGLFQGRQLLSARPLTRHAGHRSRQGRVGASRPRDHFWALTWLFWEPSTRRLCLLTRISGRLVSLCRRQAAPGRPSLGGSLGHQPQSSGFTPRTALGPLPWPVRGHSVTVGSGVPNQEEALEETLLCRWQTKLCGVLSSNPDVPLASCLQGTRKAHVLWL